MSWHGPDQCHDITVYPAMGVAGGACAGYGLLLDIRDPAHPIRVAAASDSNFAYWHSATFNNDATKVIFTDEWGGGVAPRCRATDKPEWGADAIFTIADKRALTFHGYYKVPAQQTSTENCVAHNGNLIPVPGRDIMIQGWYQGGVSLFDFTDPAHPNEIAYFDRGPMDSTKLEMAGSWSAYWYNGYIYSTEIARGLDVLELQPNAFLTQNELDAAKLVKVRYLNVQDQQRITWPASFVVARAYLDQLERSKGLRPDRIGATRTMLASAERTTSRSPLTSLATQLERDAAQSTDGPRAADPPPAAPRSVTATRAAQPPIIDGRDDDAVWRLAKPITQFQEWRPSEGGAPKLPTEAKIAYDAGNLYIFVRAFDPHPDSIITVLARRDYFTPSDKVWLFLDSYHDRRTGFEFGVNPSGVKLDAQIYNDGNEDFAWDAVWDVATRIDSLGWTAEFRIPLTQLPYGRQRTHTFGFTVDRDVYRYAQRVSWPLFRQSQAGFVSQFGEVTR